VTDFPDADLIADRNIIDNPGSQVLFPSATGLEKAMADVDAERLIRIYAEAIIDVWDPYKIAARNLPYLAWAMGVNLWEDDWRELTKRTWTARQWEFKSKRGTAAGLRMAVDYIGRDVSPFGYQVTKLTTPPQRVYSGPSLTREEREAWLADMPQLRVWRIQERGVAGFWKVFYGGRGTGRQHDARFCLGGVEDNPVARAITPTTAIERLKRRARWIVHGEETDITVSEFGTYWRLRLRGVEDSKVFVGRPFGLRRFYIPSDAAKRLITIMPKDRLSWRSPVWASLEPVTAEPERIMIGGMRRHSVFSGGSDPTMQVTMGGPLGGSSYYAPSDAWARVFERYAINDGSAELLKRRPVQFMGTGRYGFPKYTAWVGVSLRSKRKWAVFDGVPFNRFFLPHDPTPVKRVKAAVQASKKIADRILLELGPVPRFVAGRAFIAGTDSFMVGRP
jgi:phage tail P2-like protein